MRKTITLLTILLLVVFMIGCENSLNPIQPQTQTNNEGISLSKGGKVDGCATITSGEIMYSPTHYLAGNAIPTGFNSYGYNYQGHMFKGSYFNSYAGTPSSYGKPSIPIGPFGVWEGDDAAYLEEFPDAIHHSAWPYREIKLTMKWSDTWIANTDCNDDGLLDRGYACDPVLANNSGCPGAWLTNHMSGKDFLVNGKEYKWTYFTKIITPPDDAVKVDGIWYSADGVEIGPEIWGAFATIHTVSNDKYYDERGLIYKSPLSSGLGYYNP